MSSDPTAQVPTPDEILTPGINKLVALKPRALPHINAGTGGYANIFAGWRAQVALLIRRIGNFARNGRLPFSQGDALDFLAGSEFDTIADKTAQKAVGQVTMTRTGTLPGGTIFKGARFTRPADTSSQRLWADASFECAVDTLVPQGSTSVTVPLMASREGSFANRPSTGTAATEIQIADDIVDRTSWVISSYEMGGGSDGVSDADVQQYAQAFSQGQYGPTEAAALAGAFKAGAKHVVPIDDVTQGALQLYIADASWAGSTRWASTVRQSLYDQKLVGFGCKVLVSYATNTLIGVEATCKVRSPNYLAETSAIDVSIQKALRKYFDERPDWNRWKLSALRGIIARADRRLLTCSSVTVKDYAGVTLTEPTSTSSTHFMVLQNGAQITYQSPGA